MAVYQEEKITEITPECARTRAREVKRPEGVMSQQREKMSTQKQSIGSKKEAWCRTARYRKWKRHGSRREQQEEASGPEATWVFTAQCSCLTLMGVNILPHR